MENKMENKMENNTNKATTVTAANKANKATTATTANKANKATTATTANKANKAFSEASYARKLGTLSVTDADIQALTKYALMQLASNNPSPASALISVEAVAKRGKELLLACGAGAVITARKLEAPTEWRGIQVTNQIKYKKNVPAVFRDQLGVMALAIADVAKELDLKKEADKAEKKQALLQEKATADHWNEKLARLAKEAKKHGFKLNGVIEKA